MVTSGNGFVLSGDTSKNVLVYKKMSYKILEGIAPNVFIVEDPVDGLKYTLKICKKPKHFAQNKLVLRFDREIIALKNARTAKLKNVIKILFDGNIRICGSFYRYYVMEMAKSNLKDLLENNEIDIDERFKLCMSLVEGLKDLHSIGVYHRDIKPENVLLVDGFLKIADLGLIAFREDDNPIDKVGDRIGPFGWLSPEAMNKVYTENGQQCYDYDCMIDEQSDVFQLGKLFWYIFQGNVPIGQVLKEDFKRNDDELFDIIFNMTQYSKDRRCFINNVEEMLVPLAPRFHC